MENPTRETIDTSTLIDHIAVNINHNISESGALNLGLVIITSYMR